MSRAFGLLLALAAWLLAGPALAAPMQQAFLVQNSGWMEPFYTDPASPLKPLVAAVIKSVVQPQDNLYVSAFNQSTGDNRSPLLLARGAGNLDPNAALSRLAVALKNKRGALADTDFREAIEAVIKSQFNAKPGIIWIFTNNKNSPNNDPQTAERNRDFYRLLHLEPSITRTLAFPLRMPVQGKVYKASGLMVYALAYGQSASVHLNQLVESGRIGKVFTHPPARLKPLDRESVRLLPASAKVGEDLHFTPGADGKTLVVDIAASKVVPELQIDADFKNLLYPYQISSATPVAALVGSWGRAAVAISPQSLASLAPGESSTVSVRLPLPMAQVPSPWSPKALKAMGKQVTIAAVLEVELQQQKLAISDAFTASLGELFPGDPLSEVFQPPPSVDSSVAQVPLLIRIQYPMLPVIAAALGALLLLAAALTTGWLAGRTVRYPLIVDGASRNVAVKAFRSADVLGSDGAVVGRVRRGLGKPQVVSVSPDHSISVK